MGPGRCTPPPLSLLTHIGRRLSPAVNEQTQTGSLAQFLVNRQVQAICCVSEQLSPTAAVSGLRKTSERLHIKLAVVTSKTCHVPFCCYQGNWRFGTGERVCVGLKEG